MKTVEYSGHAFSVERFETRGRSGGSVVERVVNPDAVVVVPVDRDGTIVLEREFRPVVGKYVYELPSGKLGRGESPVSGARRELMEETGYIAGRLVPLFRAYQAPGTMTQMLNFFLATRLRKSRQRLDPDEVIEVRRVRLPTAIGMVKSGRMNDSASVAGLMFYYAFVAKR